MINANKPAMPIELNGFGNYAPESHTGLTKREMIAMYAPIEIPEWYRLSFKADTSMIDKPILSEHEVNMMNEYTNDNYGLSNEDFKIGEGAFLMMREYHEAVRLESEERMYFSWRSYYSDALLKELEK